MKCAGVCGSACLSMCIYVPGENDVCMIAAACVYLHYMPTRMPTYFGNQRYPCLTCTRR